MIPILVPLALAAPLPTGWDTAPPSPQTYTATYRYHSFSSCSQSWSNYTVDAAMTVTLAADGTAAACRERRAEDVGPDGRHISADFQSLSGSYTRDGDWIALTLSVGGEGCGAPQSSHRRHATWRLRCTAARPPADTALGRATAETGAPLVCRFVEPVYSESLGIALVSLVPEGEWTVFGAEAGLAIAQDFDTDSIAAALAEAPAEPLSITPLVGSAALGSRVADLVFEAR